MTRSCAWVELAMRLVEGVREPPAGVGGARARSVRGARCRHSGYDDLMKVLWKAAGRSQHAQHAQRARIQTGAPVLAAALCLLLGACGTVAVKPPAAGTRAEARPRDCTLEFLKKAPPDRAYDELGELYGYWAADVRPENVLREKACELGADAVVITQDFLVSTDKSPDRKLLSGIAIKYRDGGAAPAHQG